MQVAELLKLRLQVCMKGVQSALQTRAKNIKKIEAQKQRFNRSQWQPVVQLQKPMFSRHSAADTATSKAATSATTTHEPHSTGAGGQAAYRVTADGADVGAATHTQPRPPRQGQGAMLAKPSAVVERRNLNSGGVAASGGAQLGGGLRQRQGAQVEATPGGTASYMTPGMAPLASRASVQHTHVAVCSRWLVCRHVCGTNPNGGAHQGAQSNSGGAAG